MPWSAAGMLGLVLLGYLTIWIGFINRVHARPWGSRTLKRIRHTTYVIAPALLVIAFLAIGRRELTPEIQQRADFAWFVFSALCLTALCFTVVRRLLRILLPAPTHLLKTESTVHDISEDLGSVPLAPGRRYSLARLPGNDQFRLEFSRKDLFVPGLPAAWEGLSILHLSDFHFKGEVTEPYFIRAMEIAAEQPVDMICFTGDLLDAPHCVSWVKSTLGQLKAPLGKFFILGNHDWYLNPQSIRETLQQDGWQDVSGRVIQLIHHGSQLSIGGDETPWMGSRPAFSQATDFRLLLGHTPDHFGWAQSQRVNLMLSGHNHGGQVKLPVVGPIFAPSRYGVQYTDGTFWASSTLLHVVRGLAGQHPFRWRCLPEISQLVLHGEQPGSSK